MWYRSYEALLNRYTYIFVFTVAVPLVSQREFQCICLCDCVGLTNTGVRVDEGLGGFEPPLLNFQPPVYFTSSAPQGVN